jgi:hypothetical protein
MCFDACVCFSQTTICPLPAIETTCATTVHIIITNLLTCAILVLGIGVHDELQLQMITKFQFNFVNHMEVFELLNYL